MSKKRPEKTKDRSEKSNSAAEDHPPTTFTRLNEKCANQTIEDYTCSGNLHVDLRELCLLVGIKEIPVVTQRRPASSNSATDRDNIEHDHSEAESPLLYPQPCVLVVLENEDPLNLKSIKICGWKVDALVERILCKIIPSLSNLQSLHFWQARLSDQMVISLNNTLPLCSNLRTVVLEGNPLPEHSYHLLLSKDSTLTHLSLRNNRIGEEGARLIGSALSTATSANRNLVSLNLAFNSIGDAGATHLAQGLRLNRALLCLSLCSNKIGDTGAAHLAKVLGPFALTHKEVVERRRLLLDREQTSSEPSPIERSLAVPSNSSLNTNTSKAMSRGSVRRRETSRKEDKPAVTKKDDAKSAKKSSEPKAIRGKAGKSGAKEKNPSVSDPEDKPSGALNEVEPVESPLLETSVQHRDGQVLLSGNTALCYLSLSGNQISEQSLPLFLSSLQKQTEGGGLLRLSLQRNRFSPDFEDFVKIQELMALRDPLNKTTASQLEQEGQGD